MISPAAMWGVRSDGSTHFSRQRLKARIVLEGLKGRPVSELGTEHQISQAQYYQWRGQAARTSRCGFWSPPPEWSFSDGWRCAAPNGARSPRANGTRRPIIRRCGNQGHRNYSDKMCLTAECPWRGATPENVVNEGNHIENVGDTVSVNVDEIGGVRWVGAAEHNVDLEDDVDNVQPLIHVEIAGRWNEKRTDGGRCCSPLAVDRLHLPPIPLARAQRTGEVCRQREVGSFKLEEEVAVGRQIERVTDLVGWIGIGVIVPVENGREVDHGRSLCGRDQ
ncbi:MAG: transposase [candidate division Zixibacteria bacterium]|nr:transposase [candidate division Zixibacteria bacterium]